MRRRAHRSLGWIAAFLACGIPACGEEAVREPALRPVRSIEIVTGPGVRERTFAGVTVAGLESGLSFRIPGTLARLPISVGQTVVRGEEIAALDPADHRLRVREAEAGLAQARATVRNARSSYDRTRELYENGTAAKSQLEVARATWESAVASVEAAETRLELARSQLGYTILRAPFEGAIAAVPVEINENVRAGETVVLLTGGETLEVEVGMPQGLISYLRPGMSAVVRLDALPDREIPATVAEVGAAATGRGATFPVRVRLDVEMRGARPGMAASASFAFPAVDDVVVRVPSVAVGEDARGRYVWVVEPLDDTRGTVRRRPVTVGALTGSGLEIVDGLDDGERVVVAGVSRIRDEQIVRLGPDPIP